MYQKQPVATVTEPQIDMMYRHFRNAMRKNSWPIPNRTEFRQICVISLDPEVEVKDGKTAVDSIIADYELILGGYDG
jgi:hypothetical protein